MGRIKSTMIKRTTEELLEQNLSFNGDFENNKKILSNTMPSKKVRNKIAGYISRLEKRRRKKEKNE